MLLSCVGKELFETVISVPLLLEYEDVLSREYVPVSQEAINDILDYLCWISKRRRVHYLWRPMLRDPKDDHILELAVESQCTSIITHNLRDFEGAKQFGLKVETPGEYIERTRCHE